MIWLIGNKGMLGSEIELKLKQQKIPYVASDKDVSILDQGQIHQFLENNKSVNWIINSAAYTAVDKAESEEELAQLINGQGVFNLARAAHARKIKLIHISTDYVFDGNKTDAYIESDSTGPIGAYGRTKLNGEEALIQNLKEHFILRTSWLYGFYGPNFVYTMLRLFKENNLVKVVGDQFGSPTWTDCLSSVILEIISQNSENYGIYHFSNEDKANWYEFACKILELSKKHGLIPNEKPVEIKAITTAEYPTKAVRPKNSLLSKEKIKNTFKISIKPWDKALEEFILQIKNKKD